MTLISISVVNACYKISSPPPTSLGTCGNAGFLGGGNKVIYVKEHLVEVVVVVVVVVVAVVVVNDDNIRMEIIWLDIWRFIYIFFYWQYNLVGCVADQSEWRKCEGMQCWGKRWGASSSPTHPHVMVPGARFVCLFDVVWPWCWMLLWAAVWRVMGGAGDAGQPC